MCVSTSSPAYMTSPSANASRVVEWAYLLRCSLFSSLQVASSTAMSTSAPSRRRGSHRGAVSPENNTPTPALSLRLLCRVVACLGGLHPKPGQV